MRCPNLRPDLRPRPRSLVLVAALAGCASSPVVPAVRFANAPAVQVVDDRRDVPRKPETHEIPMDLYRFDAYVDQVTRTFALDRPRRALGVNALDEVPDSTWFTNRIGVRTLSPDEIRTGPARDGSPEPYKPWTIHSTKVGGVAVGFIITDARGVRWLLKFEEPGLPEIETGADAIASRLLWAAGYNVPEDHVVYLRPEDLVLAPDAKIKGPNFEAPLDRAELAHRLARIDHGGDGRLRATASRMLDGKPLGGHPGEGVRRDDPNDRIPHELRRDLRGAYSFFAWLDQTDAKEDNTLDMWVTDPAIPERHYVKHYLVDFGKSLGMTAVSEHEPRSGYEYNRLDWVDSFRSFATLGIAERLWERRNAPALRGVGLFEAQSFDPDGWKPNLPAYLPFRVADAHDKLWAAKIMIRFTREQIRAAVDSARYSDPRAAEYITEVLVARQRATAAHWFWRIAPLDRFELARGSWLCFDDLMIVHRIAPVVGTTRYTVTAYDRSGRKIGAPLVRRPNDTGRACVAPVPMAGGGAGNGADDGYTILRIDTRRLSFRGTTFVHVARDPGGGPARVIGVWRP